MPLYLKGTLTGCPGEVSWYRGGTEIGAPDRRLVLQVSPALFMVLPGLKMVKEGWTVDMSKLPVPGTQEEWIPRRGTFPADVKAGTQGYVITLDF
ncbi:MAG TPA: hypothetical protein VIP10_13190 [Burkholderiaceae bacterium]